MEKLEKHPSFNPAVKISDIDKEDSVAADSSDVAMETTQPIKSAVTEPSGDNSGDGSEDEDFGFGALEEIAAAEAPKGIRRKERMKEGRKCFI